MTLADLKQLKFNSRMTKAKLVELLKKRYPEYEWDKMLLFRGRYAQQHRLEEVVRRLYPVRIDSLPLMQTYTM